MDANGAAAFYAVRVSATDEQVAEGDHYEAARRAADNAGYDAGVGAVVFDERERPELFDARQVDGRPLFDWPAARSVEGESAGSAGADPVC